MKTATIKLYNLSELSETAQRKAYDEWYSHCDYFWHSDNVSTLKKFENIFPISNVDYGYSSYDSHISFRMDCNDEIEELSGIRLAKYIYNNYYKYISKGKYYSTKGTYVDGKYQYKFRHSKIIQENSCVLTGYYIDDCILEPIYNFLKTQDSSVTFYDLMDDCLQSWIIACQKDCEYNSSFEYFLENESNSETMYLENGDEAYGYEED